MSAVPPIKSAAAEGEEAQLHKIRITLSGRDVTPLEKACVDLKNKALENKFKVKGPVRMPTKILRLMVRKSPCGEGTNTFDRFQLRLHKRVVDIIAPSDLVKQLTSITVAPGVNIEVEIASK